MAAVYYDENARTKLIFATFFQLELLKTAVLRFSLRKTLIMQIQRAGSLINAF